MTLFPQIFSSTDIGAPQLSGVSGSLLSILRAILVSGYGSGENQKSGLGWSEEFTGNGKACFRGDPIFGSGYYVRICDDSSSECLNTPCLARIQGFESMDGVDSGNNTVPLSSQSPAGPFIFKSLAAGGTSRAWWAIGNSCFVYFFVDWCGIGIDGANPFIFGDLVSRIAGDRHCFVIGASPPITSFTGSAQRASGVLQPLAFSSGSASISTADGTYIARGYNMVAGSKAVKYMSDLIYPSGNYWYGDSSYTYPSRDPVTGGLVTQEIAIFEDVLSIRGYLPGVLSPLHPKPMADREIFTGIPDIQSSSRYIAKSHRVGTGTGTGRGQVIFSLDTEWK